HFALCCPHRQLGWLGQSLPDLFSIVTARMLPWRFYFDASKGFFVIDETVEKVVPIVGSFWMSSAP
ncbi:MULTISPECIES: hypothetical protein, partial [unclassified Rhizobium]|uniref:hypothetical protein n=1 Tax=unclassified Rhizobium TaxID=2613769 RepID=UPI00193E11E1